ncbi:hypothetical protein [Algibacter aquimarinus]|uniref:DNA primase n=1 Tax=Algibacter aquimarinus TaxID=1136748 RepID=A0ABP9HDC9_9FLAO
MIRKIVDYQKLNEDILNLLVEKFPDGYDEGDIISFRNAKNEIIETVEVKTDDVTYLVKVGVKLIKAMEDFGDDEDLDEGTDESDINVDGLHEDD